MNNKLSKSEIVPLDTSISSTAWEVLQMLLKIMGSTTPLTAPFVQLWNDIEMQRLRDFVSQLSEDFQKQKSILKQNSADIEKLKEEYKALFEKSLRQVVKEPDEHKRHIYPKLLVNMLATGNDLSYSSKVDTIDFLNILTHNDLKVLSLFKKQHNLQGKAIFATLANGKYTDEQQSEWIVSLRKLEARGLISDSTNLTKTEEFTGDKDDWRNQWKNKSLEILPFGKQLLRLIS